MQHQIRQKRQRNFPIVLILLMLLSASSGYGQVTTATLFGRVVDPSGSVIAGTQVTVINDETAVSKDTIADPGGEFTIPFLPVGNYTVILRADGFKSYRQAGLSLSSGQKVNLVFTLELGVTTETISVTAEAPLLNTVSAEQDINIDSQQVSRLPAVNRDITNLIGLGTGASSNGNTIVLNGLPAHGFTFSIDGVDGSPDAEFPSLSQYQNFNFIKGVSMEAVQEVETSKNIFSAEVYQALSGNVNLISKSGTNTLHGSLFEYYQSGGLNANNHLLARKAPLVMHQYGGSLGGPIKRDKLFFFTAFEGYRRNEQQVLSGQVPSRWIRQTATAAIPESARYWDVWPEPTGPEQVGSPDASFVGTDALKFTDDHTSTRVDWTVNDKNFISGRFTWGHPYRRRPDLAIRNGQIHAGLNANIAATYTRSWSPSVTSETRFGYNRADLDRLDEYFEGAVPIIIGPGIPATDAETTVKDGSTSTMEHTFSKVAGKHSLKVGGVYRLNFTRRAGGEIPQYTYSSIADIMANVPSAAYFVAFTPGDEVHRWVVGGFVQDDVRVTPDLTVNLGLRWDYSQVPRERDGHLFNRDGPYRPYRSPDSIWNTKYNMWSPRVSFAYSLNDKTVIRAGAGIFYVPFNLFGSAVNVIKPRADAPYAATLSRGQLLDFGIRYPQGSDDVFPRLGASGISSDFAVIDPNWENAYSAQWSFGIQRQLHETLMWEVSYVANRGLKLEMAPTWNRQDRVTGLAENAAFSQFAYLQSADSSKYHSLQTSLKKRFADNLLLNWAYTYASNTTYWGAQLIGGSAVNGPQDLNDLASNHGPTNFHVRHRMTIDWLYELPFGQNGSAAQRMLLGGWQISGALEARTGTPLLIQDPNGGPGQRPDIIVSSRKEARRENFAEPLSNGTYQFLERGAFASVPLNASKNRAVRAGNLSRNAFYQPGRWGVDVAFSKVLRFNERHQLQFRAELFNALNHTNFATVQTNVLSSAFGRITGTEPGRRTQLSIRYQF